MKYNMNDPLWETEPRKAREGLCKYLERRRKQLLKWQPSTDRGQGIRDELLIIIGALLGYDTHLLSIASLIPYAARNTFKEKFAEFSPKDKETAKP